jgi:Protein of unknown function (DUF732)
MNKKIITAGVIAAAAIGVLGTGTASADSADFLTHVRSLGFNGTDYGLTNIGQKLCDALNGGLPISMVQSIAQNGMTDKGYTIDAANRFVAFAVTDLC